MANPQIRRLKEWRPCFGKSSAFMVQGYLENDKTKKLWRSSAIEYREHPRSLTTKGGEKYFLVGSINKKACIERGFPMKTVDMFVHGFPDNWKELLLSQYNNLTQNLAAYKSNQARSDLNVDQSTPRRPRKAARMAPYQINSTMKNEKVAKAESSVKEAKKIILTSMVSKTCSRTSRRTRISTKKLDLYVYE